MADLAPKPQRVRRRRTGKVENVDIKIEPNGKETVRVESQPVRSRRRRRRRRVRRPQFGPWLPGQGPRAGRLRRFIKREIKREGLDGPRVSVQQRVSSTFGLVGPNKSGNVELELNFFLHPSLAKEANDGTSFGPVQALAAQYALWKLKWLRLIFTPMVGASAVSGTVVRASLNLSQSPGGTNWSGLGTRVHLDMHPGQTTVFHLRGDQIGGPRDGGWWLTDTNEEGSQSAGPIVEVHTLGKTSSTFKNEPWESPLFIVEGVGLWQFANYQVKPALGMLERKQAEVKVVINADANSPITMEMPLSSPVTQFMLASEPVVGDPRLPAIPALGETIFQIVDVGADIARVYTPPPFSWLIAGGWWFLRRIFSKGRDADKALFNVYPSLADAQNDRPAIAGPTSSSTQKDGVDAEVIVTQINAPNVGPQPTAIVSTRASVPIPLYAGRFRVHAPMFPTESMALTDSGPAFPTSWIFGKLHVWHGYPGNTAATNVYYLRTNWYISKAVTYAAIADKPSAAGSYVHTVYKLITPRFSDLTGNTEFIPPEPNSGAALFHGNEETAGSAYHKVGDVVGTAYVSPSTTGNLGMVLTLVKVTTSESASFSATTVNMVKMSKSTEDNSVRFKQVDQTPKYKIRNIELSPGDYLLAVAFAADKLTPPIVKLDGTNVDLALSLPFNNTGTGGAFQTADLKRLDYVQHIPAEIYGVPYGLSGQLMPSFSIDQLMIMSQPKNSELYDQLIELGFKPATPCSEWDVPPPLEFHSETTDSSSSDEDDDEMLEIALKLLLDHGRLPNGAEIAYRAGDYKRAYQLYKAM